MLRPKGPNAIGDSKVPVAAARMPRSSSLPWCTEPETKQMTHDARSSITNAPARHRVVDDAIGVPVRASVGRLPLPPRAARRGGGGDAVEHGSESADGRRARSVSEPSLLDPLKLRIEQNLPV